MSSRKSLASEPARRSLSALLFFFFRLRLCLFNVNLLFQISDSDSDSGYVPCQRLRYRLYCLTGQRICFGIWACPHVLNFDLFFQIPLFLQLLHPSWVYFQEGTEAKEEQRIRTSFPCSLLPCSLTQSTFLEYSSCSEPGQTISVQNAQLPVLLARSPSKMTATADIMELNVGGAAYSTTKGIVTPGWNGTFMHYFWGSHPARASRNGPLHQPGLWKTIEERTSSFRCHKFGMSLFAVKMWLIVPFWPAETLLAAGDSFFAGREYPSLIIAIQSACMRAEEPRLLAKQSWAHVSFQLAPQGSCLHLDGRAWSTTKRSDAVIFLVFLFASFCIGSGSQDGRIA